MSTVVGSFHYDPRTSVWQSPDPILGEYMDGGGNSGGVYRPINLSLFTYTHNNPENLIDPDGEDILVIHNGATDGNPFGHTALAVEGAGVYSPGNAAKFEPNVNNNIMGGNLKEYIQRESSRRDTRFTLIKTSPEQDQKILKVLKGQTSKSGYFDNCAARIGEALDELSDELSLWDKFTTSADDSGILPISVEWRADALKDNFGGNTYSQPKVNSKLDASKIIIPKEFEKFEVSQ